MSGHEVVGGYRDPAGARHDVVVQHTAAGEWHVLDRGPADTRVVDTLDDRDDDRPQAEAIARDYLAGVARIGARAGRQPADAVPEQGGVDDHSDRRPRRRARHRRARRTALSRPAG